VWLGAISGRLNTGPRRSSRKKRLESPVAPLKYLQRNLPPSPYLLLCHVSCTFCQKSSLKMCDGLLDITGRFYTYCLGCACGNQASILGFVLHITAQHQHSVQHYIFNRVSESSYTHLLPASQRTRPVVTIRSRCVEICKKSNWLTYVLYGL